MLPGGRAPTFASSRRLPGRPELLPAARRADPPGISCRIRERKIGHRPVNEFVLLHRSRPARLERQFFGCQHDGDAARRLFRHFLKLQRAQIDALAARSPAVAARFGRVAATPVAFTHVKLFDAENGRFLADQTVVANAGRISAVGPSASVAVPPGARIIDGTGKTLTPGLLDRTCSRPPSRGDAAVACETSAPPGATSSDRRPQRPIAGRIALTRSLFLVCRRPGPLQAHGGVSSREEKPSRRPMAKEKGFTGQFYTR